MTRLVFLLLPAIVWAAEPAPEVPRTDYLTFAQGALALSIEGPGKQFKVNDTHAVRMIDGDPSYFLFSSGAPADVVTDFVYELPALTTFDRLAVPDVNETPSPSQTFTKHVEVLGSSVGPDSGFELIASGTLTTHDKRGLETELAIVEKMPVRWVKLRLSGGIDIRQEKSFLEFSEIIGNGTQEPVKLAEHFNGIWKRGSFVVELEQDGPAVSGCYEFGSKLSGTVTGNILRATGTSKAGIPSTFIFSVMPDGMLRGVRSSNGGPFRLADTPVARAGTTTDCSDDPKPELGCGSIIHGINFDYDSATIRPDAAPVLQELFEGLSSASDGSIVIEGHTSSEGADAYNLDLSERRAQAVVDELVRRGIDSSRLSAAGKGESQPIAPNDGEAGRSINRRVEIKCS